MANFKLPNILNLLREARFVQSVEPAVNGMFATVALVRVSNKYRPFRSAAADLLRFLELFSPRIASTGTQHFDRFALDGPSLPAS